MTSKRFNPEIDLAPMPFDDCICRQALEMKKSGLAWQPHVGCFVWDPEEFIKPTSPFPSRIYFILSLARFIEIFDSVEQIAEKLVWLPTWNQAQILCQQLGISDQAFEMRHFFSDYQHITRAFYRLNKEMDRLHAIDKDNQPNLYQHMIDDILKRKDRQVTPGDEYENTG